MNNQEFIAEIIERMQDHADLIVKKEARTGDEQSFLEGYDKLYQCHEVGEEMEEVLGEARTILEREKQLRQNNPQYKSMSLPQIVKDISSKLGYQ